MCARCCVRCCVCVCVCVCGFLSYRNQYDMIKEEVDETRRNRKLQQKAQNVVRVWLILYLAHAPSHSGLLRADHHLLGTRRRSGGWSAKCATRCTLSSCCCDKRCDQPQHGSEGHRSVITYYVSGD